MKHKAPIICGREPTATEDEKNLAADRSAELSSKVNQVSILSIFDYHHLDICFKRNEICLHYFGIMINKERHYY